MLLSKLLKKRAHGTCQALFARENVDQEEITDHHDGGPRDQGVEALALTLSQSQELLGIAKIDLNGPAAGIVIEDLFSWQIGFGAEKAMPLFFRPTHKDQPDGSRQGQLYIKNRCLKVPTWYGLETVSCHFMPKLFERPSITLVGVAGFCGFEPAHDPVADFNDLGDQTIVGKPAVEEDKPGIDAIAVASLQHLDQDLGLLAKGLRTPLPSAATLVQ